MTYPELKKCEIHPTAVLQGDIELAEGISVGAYSVLTGPLFIEVGCTIGSHCVIGGSPEHRSLSSVGRLYLGTGSTIRDCCVIHHGTCEDGTRIGADCYIMSRSYVAHDCQIECGASIAAGCCLGGFVRLMQGAHLGMNSTVHQHTTIGAYAMIGQSTPVTKDVPPLCVAAGNPIKFRRINEVAIQRARLDVGQIQCAGHSVDYSAASELVKRLVEDFQQHSSRRKLFEPILQFQASRKPR